MRGIGKNWLASIVALGMVMTTIGVASAEFKPGEIIVKYRPGTVRNKAAMEELYYRHGVRDVQRLRGRLRGIEHYRLREGQNMQQVLAALKSNPDVVYAQPNYILRALPVARDRVARPQPGANGTVIAANNPPRVRYPCWIPGIPIPPGCSDDDSGEDPGNPGNGKPPVADRPEEVNPPVADPNLGEAYGIAKTGADQAWSMHAGNSDFVVAVIDTGVDYNHEDMAFNMWRNPNPSEKNDITGYDFIHDDGMPFDDNQHGTHCAGVIGATGSNGVGISGINQRVSIMALKFLSAQGSGDVVGAIKAIDYAIGHGARVLSNSWGGGSESDNYGLKEAIQRAEAAGVLFVAAAGNESNNNDTNPAFPASFNVPNVMSVAASDNNDRLAYFSNYGANSVHLAAPGVRVYSSTPGNQYAKLSGTSMACPHVAGAAALIWSANPSMSYQQVKDVLLQTVDPVDAFDGKVATKGRLNVFRALQTVMQ